MQQVRERTQLRPATALVHAAWTVVAFGTVSCARAVARVLE